MEEVRAIQAAREESADKRKELVEQVKQLKAADDIGRLAMLNTTMRAFQKEVERLSSRAMFAEAAFERVARGTKKFAFLAAPWRSDSASAARFFSALAAVIEDLCFAPVVLPLPAIALLLLSYCSHRS